MNRPDHTDATVGAAVLLLIASLAGQAEVARSDASRAGDLEHSIREQLDSREFSEAASRAEHWIAQAESDGGRYDIALAQPLVLLGDARMGLENPAGALEAYDRARHIVRLSDGIQGTGQLDILYREADAFGALGEWVDANQRQELAYDISRRTYGQDDRRHQESTHKLIRWYRHHHKNLAAHVLFERLITSVRDQSDDESRLIQLLREHARLWRHEMFGRRKAGRGQFDAWPPGMRRLPPWREFSPFREGRDALRRVVELHEESAEMDEAELVTALLDYADWHLLFGEYPTAVRNYRRVWRLLEADPDRRSSIFNEPTPLLLPLPPNPEKRRLSRQDGLVQLALTVNHRGRVVGRKTLLAEPRTIMEHRVRMAAKKARYRPAFRDGNPVRIKGHPLEFTYDY